MFIRMAFEPLVFAAGLGFILLFDLYSSLSEELKLFCEIKMPAGPMADTEIASS